MNLEVINDCAKKGYWVFSEQSYDDHRHMVLREAAKRGRPVLEFRPQQGWGPLCGFLGKDMPDEPFPRLNEKKTFQLIRRIFIVKGVLSWMAVGAGVWASWRFGPSAFGYARELWSTYV
ncbi:hypothetical protein F5Y18DRAFT_428854 [Xylariaceae sp. FL1019]|nr:hypothetical protein F5Y18DRAFT_428854 [Xylariaceae sp. FL1019]